MSKITIARCDGCYRASNQAEIVDSKPRYQFLDNNTETIDMCEVCCGEEKYICNHCRRVHDDAHLCECIKAMQAESVHPHEVPLGGGI